MGARTSGREAALKMLFGLETTQAEPGEAANLYWREFGGDLEYRAYAETLVHGVTQHLAELDELIRSASQHWRLERMTRIDRNLLRLSAWELKHRTEVPRAVILDEAVELAKRFGSEESGPFVNGVLNQIADNLGRIDTDR